ncbi:MAG: hypothetical protein QOG92_1662, partial [Verrucomicrobiota bacterium]|nr:hypothetical protein [Verrucomicrobiota bacterium]
AFLKGFGFLTISLDAAGKIPTDMGLGTDRRDRDEGRKE